MPKLSSPRVAVGFAALLLVLLAVLATLQYRWAGQVSEGERDRMRSSLRARANQFTDDFDRELTRAMLMFQASPDAIIENPGAALTARYAQWTAASAYPKLVGDLYYFEQQAGHPPDLRHVDRASATLQPAAWPAALAPLRDEFAARVANTTQPAPLSWPDLIDDRVPALFLPIMDVKVTRDEGGQIRRLQTFNAATPCRLAIVLLDRDEIRTRILPALADRYFSGKDGFDYHLAVLDRATPPQVIYRSDQWTPADTRRADLDTGIMNLRMTDLPGLALQPFGPGTVAGLTTMHVDRFALTIMRREGSKASDAQTVVKAGLEPRWQLVLQHRAGSLEAAVQRSRARNLILSFGVLLLLAIASTMVVVSAERARRLAAQQVEFVAGVSHELRTPVAVICSAAENLADGVIEDAPQVRRYGHLIRVEGRRLADMLERVLELAGVMSGRAVTRIVPTDLADVLDQALSALEPQLADADVAIERAIAPNLPPVAGDPSALRSAVQNLIANALKYRGSSRTIRVRAALAAETLTPTVEVVVADSGVGIDARDLPHIFEPFYRGRAAAEGQVRGTGVGLTVVKRIVEAHGGTVSVTSEPGRGSTFTIRIPADRTPAAEGLSPARAYESS